MPRLRRTLLVALAAVTALVAAAGLAATFAWSRYEASLPPLDLAASREGSTVVVDRDGRLLRPFTLPDGRWRLPATTHDVDPRYVAMLVAYEDGRFYRASRRRCARAPARGAGSGSGAAMSSRAARRCRCRSRA